MCVMRLYIWKHIFEQYHMHFRILVLKRAWYGQDQGDCLLKHVM